MRCCLLLALIFLAGCQSVRGPFQGRPPERVDDPNLSIPEQERLGRDRLALPDRSPVVPGEAGAIPR
jgi:hypothetical protein